MPDRSASRRHVAELDARSNDWIGVLADEAQADKLHAPWRLALLRADARVYTNLQPATAVSKVVSDREILVTHANWSYRGGIERVLL